MHVVEASNKPTFCVGDDDDEEHLNYKSLASLYEKTLQLASSEDDVDALSARFHKKRPLMKSKVKRVFDDNKSLCGSMKKSKVSPTLYQLKEKQLEGRLKEHESKEKRFEGRVNDLESKEMQFENRIKELESKEKKHEGRVMEHESKVREFEGKMKHFEIQVEELKSKERHTQEQVKELESKEKQLESQVEEYKSKEKQIEERWKELESKENKFKVLVKEHKLKDPGSKLDRIDGQLKEPELTEKQFESLIKYFDDEKESVAFYTDDQLSPTIDGTSLQLPPSDETDILVNLRESSDPAKLVLDIIQNPIIPRHNEGDHTVIDDISVFLLEQLMRISPKIKPCVREEALKLALDLKANMKNTENSLVVLGFLLLLSIYELLIYFDEDEVLELFTFVDQHKTAVELFQTLGFANKLSDFVANLIRKKQFVVLITWLRRFKKFLC